MQYPDDQHPIRLGKVEDHMLPVLKTLKTEVNGIAFSAEHRVLGKQLKAVPKAEIVSLRLVFSSGLQSVPNNGPKIRFSKSC